MLPVLAPIADLALSFVKGSVRERAEFDIDEVVPIECVGGGDGASVRFFFFDSRGDLVFIDVGVFCL